MATKREKEYREPGTGRYSYFGDFARLCKCGHSLGVHVAGGFECGTDPTGGGEPESAGCLCERFRPSGKRKPAVTADKPLSMDQQIAAIDRKRVELQTEFRAQMDRLEGEEREILGLVPRREQTAEPGSPVTNGARGAGS